jgi:hypothetical protein
MPDAHRERNGRGACCRSAEANVSYPAYKVLHLIGVLFLFTSLGGMAILSRSGSTNSAARKLAMATHGIALAVILVAGFGLLARLGFMAAMPTWAWLKIGIWLLLALAVLPLRRAPRLAGALWIALPLLGGVAAWLAVTKPF